MEGGVVKEHRRRTGWAIGRAWPPHNRGARPRRVVRTTRERTMCYHLYTMRTAAYAADREGMMMKQSTLWLGSGLSVLAAAGLLGLRHASADPVIATVAVGRAPWRVVVDGASGRVFVVNRGGGTVSVLDSASASLVATAPVGSDPVAAAVDERTRRVFVSNNGDATVSVLDARTGGLVRTTMVGTSPQWLAVDARTGRVFVPNRSDNTVSVLDAATGAVVRTVAVGVLPSVAAVDARTNRVFVRCNSGYVDVLDARDGTMLRATRVGSAPWGQVAVDEQTGRVFVTNPHDQTVSVLDARDGVVLHTVAIGAEGYQPIVDARTGHVVVVGPAGVEGRAIVLDARDGALLRTVAQGYSPWPAIASTGGGAVLIGSVGHTDSMGDTTGRGSVSVLDARDGVAGRVVPVGVFPVDMAVDRRTGHAFVVNYTARWSDGGPVGAAAPEGWWASARRWLSRRVALVPPPALPPPSVNGSVTVLDVSRL